MFNMFNMFNKFLGYTQNNKSNFAKVFGVLRGQIVTFYKRTSSDVARNENINKAGLFNSNKKYI